MLNGAPLCPPEDEDAKRELKKESERQTWFQNEANDTLKIPNGYLKVSVLIIRWHEDIDEFEGHNEEIARLETLFRTRFNYHCEVTKLKNCKNPQLDLDLAILQHISNHDGPDNLLIIYYTGHGNLVNEESGQRLELSATQNWIQQRGSHIPVAFWDEAEAPLRNLAEGDVLSILDCCFASSAALKSRNEDFRTYQLLAASSPNDTTSCPGANSFTTALIDSLEDLLDEHKGKSFPVIKLWERINLKRKKSASLIWDRLHKYKRTVQLAPLEPGLTSQEEREKSFQSGDPEKASLTLRFSLKADELSRDQIENLARQLPQAFRDSEVLVRRIDWVKMETSSRAISFPAAVTAISAAKGWRQRTTRKNSTAENQEDIPTRKRSRTGGLLPSSPSKRRVSGRTSISNPQTPISPRSIASAEEFRT
ncbi:hypothetical protein K505DRAFT_301288 [Melanomma pulvis-pyrius CBS 109.77]|uniref:Uncharacterized protein n=1 Tax=Melanomma pulvis-pyrius CBS 109.77 TaxID=1314802 RepID=A0A6A6XIH1_9PLEO|nr:hypothetical protein K505DRAFT_301288 [Melanomma pulvis-pyrius CBS 109.77]